MNLDTRQWLRKALQRRMASEASPSGTDNLNYRELLTEDKLLSMRKRKATDETPSYAAVLTRGTKASETNSKSASHRSDGLGKYRDMRGIGASSRESNGIGLLVHTEDRETRNPKSVSKADDTESDNEALPSVGKQDDTESDDEEVSKVYDTESDKNDTESDDEARLSVNEADDTESDDEGRDRRGVSKVSDTESDDEDTLSVSNDRERDPRGVSKVYDRESDSEQRRIEDRDRAALSLIPIQLKRGEYPFVDKERLEREIQAVLEGRYDFKNGIILHREESKKGQGSTVDLRLQQTPQKRHYPNHDVLMRGSGGASNTDSSDKFNIISVELPLAKWETMKVWIDDSYISHRDKLFRIRNLISVKTREDTYRRRYNFPLEIDDENDSRLLFLKHYVEEYNDYVNKIIIYLLEVEILNQKTFVEQFGKPLRIPNFPLEKFEKYKCYSFNEHHRGIKYRFDRLTYKSFYKSVYENIYQIQCYRRHIQHLFRKKLESQDLPHLEIPTHLSAIDMDKMNSLFQSINSSRDLFHYSTLKTEYWNRDAKNFRFRFICKAETTDEFEIYFMFMKLFLIIVEESIGSVIKFTLSI